MHFVAGLFDGHAVQVKPGVYLVTPLTEFPVHPVLDTGTLEIEHVPGVQRLHSLIDQGIDRTLPGSGGSETSGRVIAAILLSLQSFPRIAFQGHDAGHFGLEKVFIRHNTTPHRHALTFYTARYTIKDHGGSRQ